MSVQTVRFNTFQSVVGLAVALLLCFAASAVGVLFMPGEWYAQLRKPAFTPPNWVFGPVWTLLYISMAVAAWLVWRKKGLYGGQPALAVFLLQLVLNAAWSWLFFGLQRPDLALIDLVLLWCAIVTTIILFWRISPLAGAILLPYLAWVSFAGALNFSIWQLN